LEFVQVLETSDVPSGVVNIVSGPTAELAKTLAEHEAVDGLWSFGSADLKALIESASISNLKQTWCPGAGNWGSAAFRKECLRRATQVKNIWVPIGE
jgi:aldehyde dehydrogenase (NAD+)